MRDNDFENIPCRKCRVAYPACRRTCPCCNEYNPAYLADPQGDYCNHVDFDEFYDEEEEECLY